MYAVACLVKRSDLLCFETDSFAVNEFRDRFQEKHSRYSAKCYCRIVLLSISLVSSSGGCSRNVSLILPAMTQLHLMKLVS
jgi:hypothetical protein